jgi:hypothetical protein
MNPKSLFGLPGLFHGNPACWILVAIARETGAALLAADQSILSYAREGHLHAISAEL